MLVVFEPGFAQIGAVRVALERAGTAGELRVGGAGGPVLRPLSFGERTRIVAGLAGSPQAVDRLGAAIAAAALVEPGPADALLLEILALAMAGADGPDTPHFSAAALTVARTLGSDLRQLYALEAAEVDRLARYLAGPLAPAATDDGWQQVIFLAASPTSLEAIQRQLVLQLLARGTPEAHASDLPASMGPTFAPTQESPAFPSAGPIAHQAVGTPATGLAFTPTQPASAAAPPTQAWPNSQAGATGSESSKPPSPAPLAEVANDRPTPTGPRATEVPGIPGHDQADTAGPAPRLRFQLLPGSTHGSATPSLTWRTRHELARSPANPPVAPAAAGLPGPALPVYREQQPSIAQLPDAAGRAELPTASEGEQLTSWASRANGQADLAMALAQEQYEPLDAEEVATALAVLLDDEANLRGLAR